MTNTPLIYGDKNQKDNTIMEAKELKTNSLLYDSLINKIEEIGITGLARFYYMTESANERYKPIELTEEWLIKLGFNCVDVINRGYTITLNPYVKKYLYCSKDGTIALVDKMPAFKEVIIMNKIQYVHQLQNLYFALTGEELKITE